MEYKSQMFSCHFFTLNGVELKSWWSWTCWDARVHAWSLFAVIQVLDYVLLVVHLSSPRPVAAGQAALFHLDLWIIDKDLVPLTLSSTPAQYRRMPQMSSLNTHWTVSLWTFVVFCHDWIRKTSWNRAEKLGKKSSEVDFIFIVTWHEHMRRTVRARPFGQTTVSGHEQHHVFVSRLTHGKQVTDARPYQPFYTSSLLGSHRPEMDGDSLLR